MKAYAQHNDDRRETEKNKGKMNNKNVRAVWVVNYISFRDKQPQGVERAQHLLIV